MVVRRDGTISGSVGGGTLESQCLEVARGLFNGPAISTTFDFQPTGAEGMACGGNTSVLLQRIGPTMLPLMQHIRDDLQSGGQPMLLTLLPTNDKPPRLFLLDHGDTPEVSEQLRAEITGKNCRFPFMVVSEGGKILVEPLAHPGTVHLVGAGHIALAVAKIAAFVGFEVVVIDDRADFANRERYPDAREIRVLPSFSDCLGQLGHDDSVVIATRGHDYDRDVLAQALHSKAGYVGMIGSNRKRAAIYESLRQKGMSDDALARVHCPIGLVINAETPEEIALSIVAELVRARAARRLTDNSLLPRDPPEFIRSGGAL
jgi:xanthine dehydrogenase accessory factor